MKLQRQGKHDVPGGLWQSSGLSPLLKQGHLKQVLLTMSSWALIVSMDGDSTASGQPAPVLGHLFY